MMEDRVTTIVLEQSIFENEVIANSKDEAIKIAEALVKEQKNPDTWVDESYAELLSGEKEGE